MSSMQYRESVYTFVYLVQKLIMENQGLSRKNVNFCILSYTVHIWRRRVLFQINGLSATVA